MLTVGARSGTGQVWLTRETDGSPIGFPFCLQLIHRHNGPTEKEYTLPKREAPWKWEKTLPPPRNPDNLHRHARGSPLAILRINGLAEAIEVAEAQTKIS